MPKEKLAIIGSGISGLAAAHYLRKKYKISIFEKNDYLGGHTHTHQMEKNGQTFTLDTGFIVFNLHTYPNLLKLFKELGVEKRASNMAFSVQNKHKNLEYGSEDYGGLFAQRSKLFSWQHWKFLLEIKRFFKVATEDYEQNTMSGDTIEQYCQNRNFSKYFLDNYIVPLTSAIWSTPHTKIYNFPIKSLIPFFFNHGLLDLNRDFQWYTVVGGSNTYVKKIMASADFDVHLESQVDKVTIENNFIRVNSKGREHKFDYALMSCHSDESLAIVSNLASDKRVMLAKFPYNDNVAVLHQDESLMPSSKKAWASWNHTIKKDGQGDYLAATTYWLNKLQEPAVNANYFLTINPIQAIDEQKIIKKINYNHPLFTPENFELQKDLQKINQNTRLFFSGAYFGYGFHEDGLKSALEVVKLLK